MTELVIQISDTHIFADPVRRLGGCDTRLSLDAVLAAIAREPVRPAALLVTGDLAEAGEAEAYGWLSARLQALGLPFAVIPGNHDDPARMAAVDWGPLGRCGGTLEIGAWQCLLLDSRRAGVDHGHLACTELERLRALAGADTTRPLLVAVHHPPVAIGSPWMDEMGLRNGDAFWDALAAASRLRAVIWGHIHQNFDRRRRGARLLGAPSTCVQFAPGATRFTKDPRPPGYRRLVLCGDGSVHTRVVRVKPGQENRS